MSKDYDEASSRCWQDCIVPRLARDGITPMDPRWGLAHDCFSMAFGQAWCDGRQLLLEEVAETQKQMFLKQWRGCDL